MVLTFLEVIILQLWKCLILNRIFQASNKQHKPQISEEKRKSCTKLHYYVNPIMTELLQQKETFKTF